MDRSSLFDWNPWWNTGKVPSNWLGHRRKQLQDLSGSVLGSEITIITGVRRSGKTTLVLQTIDLLLDSGVPPKNILFANLNDASFTGVTIDDIRDSYLQLHQPKGRIYFFLDEVQEVKGWERWALKGYELKRDEKVIVTGSSSALLTGEYASILTGRTNTLKVFPLDLSEYMDFVGSKIPTFPIGDDRNAIIHHLDGYLKNGGFPELRARSDAVPNDLLSGYFNDILVRDVLLHNKVDAVSILRFSKYLMTNIAKPMTLRSLKNATGLSIDTIKSYIAILEKVYLVWGLSFFSYSNKRTLEDQRPKKYYCIDSGMRNAVSTRFSEDTGRLAENLVFLKLLKKGLSFWYWKGNNEIDFVINDGSSGTELINVCYCDSIPDREFKGFEEFIMEYRTPRNGMKVLTRDTEGWEGDVEQIPLWKWLLSS